MGLSSIHEREAYAIPQSDKSLGWVSQGGGMRLLLCRKDRHNSLELISRPQEIDLYWKWHLQRLLRSEREQIHSISSYDSFSQY